MIRMTEELTTFPSIIYSGLWVLKTLGILAKDFKSKNVRIVILITDAPPAFIITISDADFKVEILKEITTFEEIEGVESNGYISLPSQVFLGGVEGVLKGLGEGTVITKGEALLYLGKIGAAF